MLQRLEAVGSKSINWLFPDRQRLIDRYLDDLALDVHLGRVLPNGFLEGKFAGFENWDHYSNRVIPTKEVLRSLIFSGFESYDEYKDNLLDKFGDVGRKIGLSPDEITDISSVLILTEQTMEGMYRRTFEPAFTHVLRTFDRALDFVDLNFKWQKKDKGICNITGQSGYALLLMSALHDLIKEDKRKLPNGTEYEIGNYRLTKIDEGHVESDVLTIIGRKHILATNNIKESNIVIRLNPELSGYLRNALSVIRSKDESSKEQFSKIIQFVKKRLRENPESDYTKNIWNYLPVLVKIFDRTDNLAVYLFGKKTEKIVEPFDDFTPIMTINEDFRFENYDFGPPQEKDILDKVNETIKYMTEFEYLLAYILSWESGKYRIENVPIALKKIFSPKRRVEGYFHPEVLKLFPTRIAAYILEGMGPNEIFGRSSKDKGKLPLPI